MNTTRSIPRPSRAAEWLLMRCLGASDVTRSILGDLHEDFCCFAARRGRIAAHIWYWHQTLLLTVGLDLSERRQRRQPVSALVAAEIKGESMSDLFRPSAWAQDVRYAWRALRKDYRLLAFAIPIAGLGIAACASVYSVISPLLLRELPLAEPDRLVWIANSGTGGMSAVTSRTSNLRDFRQQSKSFDAITGYFAFFEQRSYNLVGSGEPERLVGVDVAQDFLDVLGIRTLHGRNFIPEEGVWDGPQAVILSHGFWNRRFAGDPAVVGQSISLNGVPREVVGVLPPTFDFSTVFTPGTRVDFLRTFPISDETDRWGNTLSMVGRLRPDATVASAQAELDAVVEALAEDDPSRWGLGARATGLREQISGPYRSALLLLAAAAAAVMLIVCVNLSNLLLASGSTRSHEMAVRSSLGASRWRLMRQMVFESLLLNSAGAVLGLLLTLAVVRAVTAVNAFEIPLLERAAVDAGALWFTTVLTLAVGLVVGLVPALRISKGGVAAAFRGARGSSASRQSNRLREGLVIAEIALACVLLILGGLLMKSFQQVLDVDLGFRPEGVYAWQVNAPRGLETLTEVNAFYDQVTGAVGAVAGVESVGLTDAMPLGRNRAWSVRAPGREYADGADGVDVFPHIVDHRYLRALQIPLVAGRDFESYDDVNRERAVILNQTAAKVLFQGQPALGEVMLNGDRELRVIGIAADVRHQSLELGSGPEMYLPIMQNGDFGTLDLVVRSRLPPASLVDAVGAAIRTLDPTLPTGEYQSLDQVVEQSVSPRRFTLQLIAAFAAVSLLLAALGIYGVLSYSVSERIPEIGIRMALGESGLGILRRVLSKTLILATVGLSLGVGGAFVVSRWMDSLLFGVKPADPPVFLTMAILLLMVATVAGLGPALRAARTDTVEALREN